jgi:hypothetical protein
MPASPHQIAFLTRHLKNDQTMASHLTKAGFSAPRTEHFASFTRKAAMGHWH